VAGEGENAAAVTTRLFQYIGVASVSKASRTVLTEQHESSYRTGSKRLTDDGTLPIDVPRNREGTFQPRLIVKHERRFTGFDDKILGLSARG
jgi:transposase-like protein